MRTKMNSAIRAHSKDKTKQKHKKKEKRPISLSLIIRRDIWFYLYEWFVGVKTIDNDSFIYLLSFHHKKERL